MIDLLYVAWNRKEMTQASFQSVLDNTDWDMVRTLIVHDDGSTDGTAQYLSRAIREVKGKVNVEFDTVRLGGPVAAMNRYLSRGGRADMFAKVDNDFVMPPRWLNTLESVLHRYPFIDIVGTEPFVGLDSNFEGVIPADAVREIANGRHGYTIAAHIGGKGLIRTDCFNGRPMHADGRQGFTQWQHKNEDVTKAWITPDIKSFGLDQLPLEPWVSWTERYVQQGWQRAWPKYAEASHEYWSWWLM